MQTLPMARPQIKANTSALLPLERYDLFIGSCSGGKDSLAGVLRLLKMGVPKEKIELWHQDIDGHGPAFMDWPITPAYCRAVAAALGIRIRFQWKEGGFKGEMLRENSLTKPIRFELRSGKIGQAGGVRGKKTTRRKFPQVSPDLSVRWCSAYLKIDVASVALNNDPELKSAKICYITGERRQESANRARYPEIEKHRCTNKKRRVDQWRNVIDWSEEQIWDIIRESRIVPHPAYYLGWGRVSCLSCIFGGPDQWASVREIAPDLFSQVADYEKEFGSTIKHGSSVVQMADKGTAYPQLSNRDLVKLAMSTTYDRPVITDDWQMPAGAFSQCAGPT